MSSVTVTGTVLANLLFEHANADRDTEGLILGSVTRVVTDTITDHSLNNVKHEIVYHATAFLPSTRVVDGLFDAACQINKETFLSVCESRVDEVIGWLRLRRQSAAGPSMRELAMHRAMQRWFDLRPMPGQTTAPQAGDDRRLAPGQSTAREDGKALFLLCVANTSPNRALHSFNHVFMTRGTNDRGWTTLPLSMPNLSSAARATYKTVALPGSRSLGAYSDIIAQTQSKFFRTDDDMPMVQAVNKLNSDLHKRLKGLCAELVNSDAVLSKEQAELSALREQLALLDGKGVSAPNALPPRTPSQNGPPLSDPASSKVKVESTHEPKVEPKDEHDLIDLMDDGPQPPAPHRTPDGPFHSPSTPCSQDSVLTRSPCVLMTPVLEHRMGLCTIGQSPVGLGQGAGGQTVDRSPRGGGGGLEARTGVLRNNDSVAAGTRTTTQKDDSFGFLTGVCGTNPAAEGKGAVTAGGKGRLSAEEKGGLTAEGRGAAAAAAAAGGKSRTRRTEQQQAPQGNQGGQKVRRKRGEGDRGGRDVEREEGEEEQGRESEIGDDIV